MAKKKIVAVMKITSCTRISSIERCDQVASTNDFPARWRNRGGDTSSDTHTLASNYLGSDEVYVKILLERGRT
jgi:hypothetical protein